ncbi:MAG: hypothetical protein ACYDAG_05555 [Chloroflexota bacterium]
MMVSEGARSDARRRANGPGLSWEKLVVKYVVDRRVHVVLEEGAHPVAVLIPFEDYRDIREPETKRAGRPKARDFMVDVDHLRASEVAVEGPNW